MSDSNVVSMHGAVIESAKPNEALISGLKSLLEDAESGQLQSFIGTGYTPDGLRVVLMGDYHLRTYEMLGALSALPFEFMKRRGLPT